ncbi:undecaprenyl-diphosphatase [Geodermatophilus bullaregiensis]|uniref:phosphatase PAP2 family protein n=1 Tax=Geodermatophilus bullaregiensis TaxID=1564160 RepID=UPI00195E6340|nr:phosphatase PAP2 family protein [Geodermatophilus bullaregiensis]MBM7806165.1 undecaprenyl-diphosphatase [Geodermatophilus bullaregiensis]
MSGRADTRPRRPVRRGRDAVLVAVGALVLVLAALPIERTSVPASEAAVFRAVNGVDVLPFALVWPVMQLGNVLVVPASALAAAVLHRWRLAAGLLLAGAGTYLAAKGIKDVVVRGRPDGLLDDVVLRGDAAQGRGFLSGHAAVVVTVLTVAWPWLGRRGRIAGVVLAAAVCLARVHVAAHLPLDVVGGVGLGLLVGGLVLLVLGRPG